MLQPSRDTRLGDLVSAHPGTTKVLLRHDLDFCCGGKQTLEKACEKKGLSVVALVAELEQTLSRDGEHRPWTQAPLPELLDHILDHYHKPLPEDLEQIQAMADKVLRVHGDKDPERLTSLTRVIAAVAADVLPHMAKEETILFPWIRAKAQAEKDLSVRHQPCPTGPIRVMEADHDVLGELLEEIKTLTDNFVPPPAACATWTNLYARLETLDLELREHIHLENNVLHPRTLAMWSA